MGLESRLAQDFAVLQNWPVQWGDQDSYGHVNNTIYLRWFETGRIAYLEKIGFDTWLESHGIGPILAAVHCNFRRQLRYPATIKIGSRITRIGKTSVTMEHAIWNQAGDDLLADGDSTVVTFDYKNQKPVRVPDLIREAIVKLEGKEF